MDQSRQHIAGKNELLQQVGGWDPYNVTEDADMRASNWPA